jgi:ankyrin repeat protein
MSAAAIGAQPAHLDAGRPGVTPLMMAAFDGADVVPLLRSGARADETAADGMTALLFAALHGRPEAVEALLDAGASLKTRNRNGMTALLLAAEYNPDPRVTALLVKRGAPVDDRDGHGRTPLIAAAGRNNADVVEVLLAAGANARAEDHDHRTAALYAQYGNGKLAGTPTFWKLYQRQY